MKTDAKTMTAKNSLISLNYKCNAKCSFCYLKDKQIEELDTETWKSIIDQLKGFKSLVILGGEPLLRNDLYEIVTHAKKVGIKKIAISTNSYLLTDEIIQKFGQDVVWQISLDYFSTKHDKVRGLSIFKKAMSLVKKHPNLVVRTTIMNDNLRDCFQFIDWTKNNNRLWEGVFLKGDKPVKQGIKKRVIQKSWGHGMMIRDPPYIIKYLEQVNKENMNSLLDSGVVCPAGIRRIHINPLGEVNPCHFMQNISFGNILKQDFATLLKKAEEWALQNIPQNYKACRLENE